MNRIVAIGSDQWRARASGWAHDHARADQGCVSQEGDRMAVRVRDEY